MLVDTSTVSKGTHSAGKTTLSTRSWMTGRLGTIRGRIATVVPSERARIMVLCHSGLHASAYKTKSRSDGDKTIHFQIPSWALA